MRANDTTQPISIGTVSGLSDMNLIARALNKAEKLYFSRWRVPKIRERYSAYTKNAHFTILCNNCFGGMLYHDLGVKFFSPTINLYFYADDYLTFLEDPEQYLYREMKDGGKSSDGEGYIGILGDTVKVIGLHYDSFETLKSKWRERSQRVDRDNLYVIGVYRDGFTDEHVERFCRLPYRNKKVIIPSEKRERFGDRDCIVYIKSKRIAPPADKMASFQKRAYIKAFDFYGWLLRDEMGKNAEE